MKKHSPPSLSGPLTSDSAILPAVILLVVIVLACTPRLSALVARTSSGGAQFTFETQGRVTGKGNYPQLAVRASGDLFLLLVRGQDLWLQSSSDGGDSFDQGVRISEGGSVASHPENMPLMAVRSMHEFYVLWTAESGHERSGLYLARSMDWGKSFSKPIPVDPASTASQSFYTMAVGPDGAVYVAWLDGRDRGQGKQGSSALYLARSTDHGQSFEKSIRVALNICPCCRPEIAFSEGRTVHIAWRGILGNDIRDMFVATSTDGAATFGAPSRVAEDNWQIDGCPHSGPSLATLNGRIFVAWRTVSGDRSRIYVAWSSDNGTHFSPKIEADASLLDANHPRLMTLDGTVGLVFQARQDSTQPGWSRFDIYFRQIDQAGSLSALQRLGHAVGSATYPALLFERPDHLFVAWTEGTDDGPKAALARGRRAPSSGSGAVQPANSIGDVSAFSKGEKR